MPNQINCGLSALSKLGNMKDVSAFTLVHLARDNGQNLHVFKVADNNDLVKVIRPAIFHQKDHFVYVGKDEALPSGEYTGFVIGTQIIGRVISLAEAKFVKGGKNFLTGKNKDGVKEGGGALGAILGVVGGIVGGLLLPGVGAALGTTISSGWGGAIGGAIGGGVGNAATGDNALLGAALGGVGGYGLGSAAGKIATGFGAAKAASSVSPGSLTGAYDSAISGVPAGYGTLANGASGASGAFGAAGTGAASAAGSSILAGSNPFASTTGGWNPASFTPNSSFNIGSATSQFSPDFTRNLQSQINLGNSSNIAVGANPGTGNFIDSIGKGVSNSFSSNPIGTASTLVGGVGLFGSKAPAYNAASPQDNYSAISQFLGPNSLSDQAKGQVSSYIATPIEDLTKQFTSNSTRVFDSINQAYDNQKKSLTHQFAQAGQNMANSSELQNQVSQLEQKRVNDLNNAQQEVQNQALTQAIQVKQQALSQGMQSGQWNQTIAMQLAGLTGDQQNLQYAIANNDYQSFQQIMGKLLSLGIPQTVKLT